MKFACILSMSLCLFPQAQTPLTVYQSSGSLTGQVWLQERRTNGANVVKIEAPQSIAADFSIITPGAPPATNGECWTSTTAGVGSWQPCGANAFVQDGNSFGTTATLGTNDTQVLAFETSGSTRMQISAAGLVSIGGASIGYPLSISGGSGGQNILGIQSPSTANLLLLVSNDTVTQVGNFANLDLQFVTDSACRWYISSVGMFVPCQSDTYDIGLDSTRIRGFYGKFLDTAVAGGTGDYVKTRKLELFDNTGSTSSASAWDLNVVMSGVGAFQNSYIYLRDNGGNNVFRTNRILSGVAADQTLWYTDLVPDTNVGQNLGSASLKWGNLYVDSIASSMYPAPTNTHQLGGSSNRFSSIYTTDLNLSGTCTGCPGVNAFIQGGNTFGATATLGTNDSNILAFETNGSTRMQISAAGLVGVGGAASHQFHILGGSGVNTLAIEDSTSSSDFQIRADSNAVYLGNQSNHSLQLFTDNSLRWAISATGMWGPAVHDVFDIGDPSTRVRTVYAKAGEFFKSGSTSSSDYVTSRKFNFLDQSGGSGAWDLHASGSMASTSSIKIRDNAGSRWLEGWRALSGSPLNFTSVFSTLTPAKRAIADSDAVNDSVFPDLGASSARWANAYLALLDTTSTKDLIPDTGGRALGSGSGNQWQNLYVGSVILYDALTPDTNGGADIGGSSLRIGKVWTADLDISGICTGCGGTPPFSDGVAILKGFSDASKLLIIDVDGFTTATTRTLTPQNASYTIAGTNIAQTFSAVQSMGANLLFAFDNTHDIGASGATRPRDIWVARDVVAAGAATAGTLNGTGAFPIAISGTAIFTSGRVMQNVASVIGDWLPFASTTYNLGSASLKWLDLHASFIDLYTDLTFNSGSTFTGSIIPSANNSYSLGNTSFRMSTVVTTNFNVSGTITAPSGASALSTTKTVRDAAGTGTCTLIYSGGLLTGGTC